MTTENRIIKESRALLKKIGASSMTMDMVARNCGISKRTLYETFPDKKTLIKTCIADEHKEQDQVLNEIFRTAENCYDALFKTYLHIRKYLIGTSMVFVNDIKRLYPEVFYRYKEHEEQHMESLAKIIAKAKEEGLALPGIKCKIAAFVFNNNIKSLHCMEELPFTEYSAAEVFDGAFLNFMRGIATREGQDIIENYVVKLLNKDNN